MKQGMHGKGEVYIVKWDMCGERRACVAKACVVKGGVCIAKGCMHGRRRGMYGKGACIQDRRPLKRAVRILLVCILV